MRDLSPLSHTSTVRATRSMSANRMRQSSIRPTHQRFAPRRLARCHRLRRAVAERTRRDTAAPGALACTAPAESPRSWRQRLPPPCELLDGHHPEPGVADIGHDHNVEVHRILDGQPAPQATIEQHPAASVDPRLSMECQSAPTRRCRRWSEPHCCRETRDGRHRLMSGQASVEPTQVQTTASDGNAQRRQLRCRGALPRQVLGGTHEELRQAIGRQRCGRGHTRRTGICPADRGTPLRPWFGGLQPAATLESCVGGGT